MISGIYLTIVMALTSVSVILTVFVLNLHYRGPHSKPVPRWLRRLMGLSRRRRRRVVQHGLTFRRRRDRSPDKEGQEDPVPFLVDGYFGGASGSGRCRRGGGDAYVQNVSLKMTMENLADELKQELDAGHGNDGGVGGSVPSSSRTPGGPPGPAGDAIHRQAALSNQEILRALQKVVERYELDDREEATVYEWRQMAVAVDRVLFWVFMVGTLSSTVLILGIVPLTKDV